MGDSVERALEETVPILQAAKRARLLTSQEIDQVVRSRRNHEYALKKQNATRAEYLKYASFERELANLLQKRADKKKTKKTTVQLIVGKTSSRVNLVYSRAVKAFRADVDLWLHYARHCVRTGTVRTAQKVLARAIAYRGDSERVWLAAIALHFDTCGDAKGARTLAQRALRAIPHSAVLWKEYFRLEVCYLSKLIIRRLAIGLMPAPKQPKIQETSQQAATAKKDTDPTAIAQQAAADPAEIRSSGIDEDRLETAENYIREDEREEERSDSSESEASKEESNANTSGVSSGGESDDSDEEVDSAGRLSFWQGGVPMTVFRRACDSVNLTAEVLLAFWVIAVSSPYVPPPLLETMSKYIGIRFPNSVTSRLIEARLDWDCAKSEFHRERRGNSERESELGDSLPDTSSESSRRVLDATAKLPGRVGVVLHHERIPKLSDSERNAALACIRDIDAALKRTTISRKVRDELNALLHLLDQEKLSDPAVSPNKNGNDDDTGLKSESWSLATLEHAIAQGKRADGDWKYGDVLSAVKQKASVPFRDLYHDKVLAQFFATERDIKSVREVSDVLLVTPPLTMQGLRCTIAAEMRIVNESDACWLSELSTETKTRLRKLFAKSEALSSARHDVEFWLLFLDFEKRKAKDARAAAAVHAKALRTLSKERVALFTELHTLRNLD